ncbi:MAG: SxtJ family membrane protein [Alphaproteobacteria bacterium]
MSSHEDFTRSGEVKRGSDRSFGLVFAGVFTLVGLWPLIDGAAPRWWALVVALVFAALAAVAPRVLATPNRLWHRFGLLLNRIVSPLALGLTFFLAVTPTGLIMRLMGKDPLRLKLDRHAKSYWIKREPPGPAPDGMPRQF